MLINPERVQAADNHVNYFGLAWYSFKIPAINGFYDETEKIYYLTLVLVFFISDSAYAAEGLTPMQPGATTGIPAGGLPSDGLYLTMDSAYEVGTVKDGNGHNAKMASGKTTVNNLNVVMSLTWVPGWQFLGARYSAMLIQPYKLITRRNTGGRVRIIPMAF
ncbi:hypothetical protein AW40_00895 [Kosakonia radicincitans UMEnt01/12]|uniref:hypothetical protein n=1 Tax=Kosakonia radicincitans TaxID=283686 RepID=UPI000461CE83|nr:hypothetical protein [Kosakonia radicincitans]KDE38371.1 hypothetical protein AW40_00895 [Kosakonia radicincitans UMEnt01/12]